MKHAPATWAIGMMLLSGVLFVVGYVVAYYLMSVAPQENTKRVEATVKAVCDYGHVTTSGELEEACGRAQDVSGTRYVCPTINECHVEED